MNRSLWLMVGTSVAGALALIWTLNWFTQKIMPEDNPGALAYQPVDDMPPRVDLAAVQRGWPDSLGEPGERNRLMAYRREIEGQAPPPAAVPQAASAPAAPLDIGALLASADVAVGKDKARACISCHDFASGGPDRIGPNLWGVVGRDIGSHGSFPYSAAMNAQPGIWTYQLLFDYLAAPARTVPGTKMSFAGMRRPEDRAAVIKYLATLGSAPPIPAPKVAAASVE